jgi:Tfp pilus assembly protein PilF
MKKLFLLQILLLIEIPIFSQSEKENLMPITTNSKSASSLYTQAKKYFDDVNLNMALETFKKALVKDPDFFMVNYQLALYYLMNHANNDFEEYADAAINCKVKLSSAEELLKSVLVRLEQGHTNIVDAGRKLVEMYPNDSESYSNLINFQSLANDSTGMVETLRKAIKVAAHPAPFYNQLGYVYLTQKKIDKAEEAFDKYIELEPDNPNVYDSKGDYYMYIKKYDKAYDSYMKAYHMDPSFSYDKAELAKQLYEQTEGKKLGIIKI